tara:strand:- start:658 stop:909 length:252 start_codon:yes stop_codon:yes gene_type:complete
MQNQVSYISAHNGGIQMFSTSSSDQTSTLVGYGKTAESIAYVLQTKGIASTIFQSSSMDFASEEGFATDDAASLLMKRAYELI